MKKQTKKKNNKKNNNGNSKLLIVLVTIFIPLIITLVILKFPEFLNRIKGDVSTLINDGIKTYELGDFVYFDPVKYELCGEDQSSTTCYRWMVINKDDNNYDLFLLNHLPYISWTSNNPATVLTLSGSLSSWSNKLSVDPSYDVQISEYFTLKFSDAKARLMLKSEYDRLPESSKTALTNYCSSTRNIVKQTGGSSMCGLLDTESQFVGVITASGYSPTFNFESMRTGSTLSENYTVRPVVNITIDDQMGNKDNIIKTVYDEGDIIYFDPVSNDECSEVKYDEAKVNKGESTCYRWRVISTDDNATKDKVNIQLDHNVAVIRWNKLDDAPELTNEKSNASIGPRAALRKLSEMTSNWTKVPLLNYEYDISDLVPKPEWNMAYPHLANYGKLKCIDGRCTTSHYNLLMASGLRARLITADEVAAITKKHFPDVESPTGYYSDRLASDWNHQSSMSHDGSGRYIFSNTSSVLRSKELAWLLENTCGYALGDGSSGCNGFGRGTNGLHTYYWTLTPIPDGYAQYSYAWVVYDDGNLNYGATNITDVEVGVRPVIEYEKKYSNVNVTFNDEERLTEFTINKGSKITEIDAQGKSGHSFLYWSKRKNGQEFDFNTPIYKDTILYAVYKKDGCTVVDTTTMSDYIEDLYEIDPETNNLAMDNNDDHSIRYINKTPNNYVHFNNELWRIIGVFNVKDESGNYQKRVKLTRNTPLKDLSFDSTPYDETSPINGGYGINDWATSDLMKLLNAGYEENSEETFKYVEGTGAVSDGVKNVNNSLYWNKTSGNCFSNAMNITSECNYTETGLSDEAKDYIDTVVWNTGAISYDKNVTPYEIYTDERGTKTTKDYPYVTSGTDDTVERSTEWTGKVGIPYISDYLMASGSFVSSGTTIYTREQCMNMTSISNPSLGACTSTNDWMVGTSPMVSMTSVYGNDSSRPSLSSVAFGSVTYTGGINAGVTNGFEIKPTVYLKTNVQRASGTGTEDDPYELDFVQESECNVTVTYNDEERITERQILEGSTAEAIDSQGKEGHTFKYWSLDETNEYDFSTPVNHDITLFAVYEKNKYNVEFYDNNEKIDTVEVVWDELVNTSNIPSVSKEGYDFLGWTEEDSEELFNFSTHITRNYKLYSKYKEQEKEDPDTPEEKCVLKISSSKYEIDTKNKLINRVPEKETIEDIEKNLVIESEDKQITSEFVRISCKDTIEEYKINRIKILSTGQLRTRYGIILLLITVMTGLLVLSRRANNKLKSMIK